MRRAWDDAAGAGLRPVATGRSIAFENKDANYLMPGGTVDKKGVIGNPKAPYFTHLAATCGHVANYHAIGYPSLPNYIAQTAGMIPGYIANKGSGVGRDCKWSPGQAANKCHVTFADSPGLFYQLGATGWLSAQASMTVNCQHGDDANGLYVQRHNPAAYFDDLNGVSAGGAPTSLACPGGTLGMTSYTAEDVPFPDPFVTHSVFTWVTPDLCDDGHSKLASCFSTNLVANADHFLQGFLPQLLATSEYQDGRMAIFLWWDSDVHAFCIGSWGSEHRPVDRAVEEHSGRSRLHRRGTGRVHARLGLHRRGAQPLQSASHDRGHDAAEPGVLPRPRRRHRPSRPA